MPFPFITETRMTILQSICVCVVSFPVYKNIADNYLEITSITGGDFF